MSILENFILEQLNLAKYSISEIKRLNSIGSKVLKVAQLVLDGVIELCRVYSHSVKWEVWEVRAENDSSGVKCKQPDGVNHIINMIRCSIEKLCELGVLAANNGGSLVTILNVSWKGVVTLLQLGKGALASKMNVANIILTLISLSNDSLRCAAEACYLLKDNISAAEARRTFVPTKFYLINALRISSLYPREALSIYKEITLCVLMISTLATSLSKETFLRTVSDVLAEFVEPMSVCLLKSLLNSAHLKEELKFLVLDWLFIDDKVSISLHEDPSCSDRTISRDAIFSVSCETMSRARVLLPGRVAVFLHLLEGSRDLEDDVKLGMTRKLEWLLNILVDEDVYSFVLAFQIPISYGSGQIQEVAWQPMFSWLLHALKSFMIVVSSSLAWGEVLYFLLENFIHPHFLCREIVLELWCFMIRHAKIDMVNDIVDKLSSLLKLVVASEFVLIPGCAFRKLVRSVCVLLTYCSRSQVDQVYCSIVSEGQGRSQSSPLLYLTLLLEGFSLNLLTDKHVAAQRIISDYFDFIGSFDEKSLKGCCSGLFGLPVFALSAASQTLQVSISDNQAKTLKFLVAVIRNYRNSEDCQMKGYYCKLLSETLGIVSNTKHLYASAEMEEVILELQNLFVSEQAALDTRLHPCKVDLAFFMAGLCHMEMAESDASLKSSAVWELYHMLLRERHWAFVHLAITGFGYFAARTSCNELWRFVPQNAALSFDLEAGKEAKEDRFMSELKTYLEKEHALLRITPNSEDIRLLVKEGLMLKEMVQKILDIDLDAKSCDIMEIDGGNQAKKRRKLPDRIGEGMELLQSGLKFIGDGLSQWQQNHIDSSELHDKFLTQFSRLEDVVAHLVGLVDSG